MSDIQVLGAFIDCSRNAVLTVEAMKRFFDILKKLGYNEAMLYTEDTFEVDGEPEFGYMRGRYTKDELKEIVAYGENLGIEVVPAINGLAHMNQLFQWIKYYNCRDTGDILLIDRDETYDLLDKMIKSLRECYNSKKINIGFDEAMLMGCGRYMRLNGIVTDRQALFKRHLEKVNSIANKYGFESIIDSDMLIGFVNNELYYTKNKNIVTEEVASIVPENVTLNYWSYDQPKEIDEAMFKNHDSFNRKITFMAGSQSWLNSTAQNLYSINSYKDSIGIAKKHGVTDFYLGFFGDDGGESDYFAFLPTLTRFADLCLDRGSLKDTKKRFLDTFGIDFDDYCKLDLPSCVTKGSELQFTFSDKYFLYNDPFMGVFDTLLSDNEYETKYYRSASRKLSKMVNNPDYGYIFATSKALCDVLTYKAVLGKHTREAYAAKDKEKLKDVVKEYNTVLKKLKIYANLYRIEWLKNKKPMGGEVQDIRHGGLINRIEVCKNRLIDYIEGRVDSIYELDTPLEPDANLAYKRARWSKIVTTNLLQQVL